MIKRLLLICCFAFSFSTSASTLLVEKQKFTTHNFETFNGQVIKEVNIGWESYGQLNQDKSNVILITHFFSGSSHAAGKYSASDEKAGYWDAIIGPGKAIDTDKYFVISSDTLSNIGIHDPNVITTGPATINPDTNQPYGLSFPVVTIRDFVNVQKALLDSLGITKLHAVIGPSMGSLQALDWAAAYPEMVERMVSVIGMAQTDAWTTAALEQWALPIKLDPNWQQGNYYQDEPPIAGLTATLMLITQQAMHPDYINQLNPKHYSLEDKPLHDINGKFAVVDWLEAIAKNRAKQVDANHVLYLIRASQLFLAGFKQDLSAGLKDIKAKSLFLPASKDLLLMPYLAKQGHETLSKLGKESKYAEINGEIGHLDGVFNVAEQAQKIAEFLAN